MDTFVIQGGRPLRGRVRVGGAKNACLPLLAATLLCDEAVTLEDVPALADIRNMTRLLEALGTRLDWDEPGGRLTAASASPEDFGRYAVAPYEIVKTMRAGICVLGPLLARRGYAKVSMPGGCAIGDRPVDLHLRGLEALGAGLELDAGYIVAHAPGGSGSGRLIGGHVFLGGPNGSSVTGTANILSAATLAEGTTVIECAACEPEVVDLADLLNAMGAKINGAGSPRIVVEGVEALHAPPGPHVVVPDRIVAGTYAIAAAITNGQVTIENYPFDFLSAMHDRLARVGVRAERVGDPVAQSTGHPAACSVTVTADRVLRPVEVVTQPHPGLPTDLQAQMMALLCLAEGNSIITEKIYQDRFMHVPELARMGARLHRTGASVIVSGVRQFKGAPVMASDLRASAGLVLAGLAASGTTVVHRVYHLDRGYDRLERTLNGLGAAIERVDDRRLPADQG